MTGISTRTVRALGTMERGTLAPPVYTSSTFAQPPAGGENAFCYQRGGNPTRSAAEKVLAALEGAAHAFCFVSGMAATRAILDLLDAGEELILGIPIYGGTYRYALEVLPEYGVQTTYLDDLNALSDADFAGRNVKMVFLESPTNPTLRINDIARIAEVAHRNGALVAVDNTFLSPYLQLPLQLGADLVVQSATKYLAGSGDLMGGVVTTDQEALAERIHFAQKCSGAVLAPIESYRLAQAVKTLPIRMDRQQSAMLQVVEAISGHPSIEKLWTPGSESEQEREVQERQARGPGAVFSLQLVPGADVDAFLASLETISFAVSLGHMESLVCIPALQTHDAFIPEHLEKVAVSPRLLRFAIGLEDPEDLIADLVQALDGVQTEG